MRWLAVEVSIIRLRQHEVSLLRYYLHSLGIIHRLHALGVSDSILLDVHDIDLLVIRVTDLVASTLRNCSL